MIWLLTITLLALLALIGFAGRLTVLVYRDRKRWRDRRARLTLVADQGDHEASPELSEHDAVDFVQTWLDSEWEQRFG